MVQIHGGRNLDPWVTTGRRSAPWKSPNQHRAVKLEINFLLYEATEILEQFITAARNDYLD